MQPPIQSNYPRARLGGEQDDQQYAALQLRAYVLLNCLIPIQLGFVLFGLGLVPLRHIIFIGAAFGTIFFAVAFWVSSLLLTVRALKLLQKAHGWSRSYTYGRTLSIVLLTPVFIGVFLAWLVRRDIEKELKKFGFERGMFGLWIDVAKAEEHLFNLRLKKAVPEGVEDDVLFHAREEQTIHDRN
ncbi:MAG TPA: hypothetical protein VK171_01025 [Fimbriimonas sp.]|nr:hypothetical protein [Fimbriimonas sp.]